ncbi:MAG: hypothetical protein PVH88_01855 [Ignavibacteria bacterium]
MAKVFPIFIFLFSSVMYSQMKFTEEEAQNLFGYVISRKVESIKDLDAQMINKGGELEFVFDKSTASLGSTEFKKITANAKDDIIGIRVHSKKYKEILPELAKLGYTNTEEILRYVGEMNVVSYSVLTDKEKTVIYELVACPPFCVDN